MHIIVRHNNYHTAHGSGQKSLYKNTLGPRDKQEVNNNINFGLVLLHRAINDFG